MKDRTALIIMSSLMPGGAERVSLALAEYLTRRGWDVHLFVAAINRSAPRLYEVPPGVGLHYARRGTESGATRPLVNGLLLKKIIRELDPTWVISLGSQYRLLDLCGVFGRRRVLLSERNYPAEFYKTQKAMDEATDYYRRADKVVFQTEAAAVCFPDLDPRKVAVIPNAVPPQDERWRGAQGKGISFAGRLDTQKNPEMLLRSFALFSDARPGYRLDVYGDGPMRGRLESLAEELGVGQSVFFHGKVADVAARLSGSLMYVSTSDYEGISNSMLEAMGMGMPCVCTDCAGGGARLAIDDGESGLLVPRGDEAAMARAMGRVADDPVFAAHLSWGAMETASKFAPEGIYGRWAELLEEV